MPGSGADAFLFGVASVKLNVGAVESIGGVGRSAMGEGRSCAFFSGVAVSGSGAFASAAGSAGAEAGVGGSPLTCSGSAGVSLSTGSGGHSRHSLTTLMRPINTYSSSARDGSGGNVAAYIRIGWRDPFERRKCVVAIQRSLALPQLVLGDQRRGQARQEENQAGCDCSGVIRVTTSRGGSFIVQRYRSAKICASIEAIEYGQTIHCIALCRP